MEDVFADYGKDRVTGGQASNNCHQLRTSTVSGRMANNVTPNNVPAPRLMSAHNRLCEVPSTAPSVPPPPPAQTPGPQIREMILLSQWQGTCALFPRRNQLLRIQLVKADNKAAVDHRPDMQRALDADGVVQHRFKSLARRFHGHKFRNLRRAAETARGLAPCNEELGGLSLQFLDRHHETPDADGFSIQLFDRRRNLFFRLADGGMIGGGHVGNVERVGGQRFKIGVHNTVRDLDHNIAGRGRGRCSRRRGGIDRVAANRLGSRDLLSARRRRSREQQPASATRTNFCSLNVIRPLSYTNELCTSILLIFSIRVDASQSWKDYFRNGSHVSTVVA